MFGVQSSRWSFLVAAALLWLASSTGAVAQQVEAKASLSAPAIPVGEAVQYQITVSGARRAEPPASISVDGLDFTYAGASTQVRMLNFDMTMSVVFTYTVVPQRTGTFTIPAQTVEAGGQRLVTNSLTLEVGGSRSGRSGPSQGGGAPAGNLAEAEIVLPKESAYVGEAIPVELRIYVDNRVRWQLEQPTQLQGEGFTATKLSEPVQNQVTKDGRIYDLVIFKTAITPAKSGTLALGPFEIHTLAQIPQRRQRPRFGIDDFDALFNDPFGAFTQTQKLTIKSDPVQLQVRALPANAPKTFSGAVGQFSLTTEAKPLKVNVGDPITLTLKVTGRGNFDRVGAPQLVEEDGWRSYPPSSDFKADDNVGLSGTKTFEMAVVPEDRQSRTPAVELAYFDPLTEKYVTLKGEQRPLVVEGQRAPAATPAPAPAAPPATAAASPTPPPRANDIHYLRPDFGRITSFKPLHHRREFWLAQAMPLLALLGFIGFQVRGRNARNVRAQELAALRRQKGELRHALRREDLDAPSFYDTAAKFIQVETALSSGESPALIDADAACRSRTLSPEIEARIRSIFEARAEALYAGRRGSGIIPAHDRSAAIEALREFEQAHV